MKNTLRQLCKNETAGELVLEHTIQRRLSAGEIRIAPLLVGLCGSDCRIFRNAKSHKPGVFGHEVVAQVIEVDSEVEQFAIGDRVTVNPVSQHDDIDTIGYNGTGFLTTAFTVSADLIRQQRLFKLAESMPIEAAVFAEPLACCVHAQTPLGSRLRNAHVLVIGTGSFGLLHYMLAKEFGAARVQLLVRGTGRFDEAFARGIVERSDAVISNDSAALIDNVQVVIVTANGTAAVDQGLRFVANGGALVLFGGLAADESLAGINLGDLRRTSGCRAVVINGKSISIYGAYGTTASDFFLSIALLENRFPKISNMISHVLDLEQVQPALNQLGSGLVFNRPVLKMVVKPS